MDSLTVTLSDDLRARLAAVAERAGLPLAEALQKAVYEYVVTWEIHLNDVDVLRHESDDRPVLLAAND